MQDALLIKYHGRTAVLRPADIQWISAEGDYVQINSSGRKYLLRDRISRLEREFAPGEFLRIHRSLLVNRMNIKELQDRPFGEVDVILDDGTKLSMARSRKTSVLKLLQGKPAVGNSGLPLLHAMAFVITLLTFSFAVGYAQHPSVDSLFATERAFAELSRSTSSDSAFRTYIAPDGVLLRPDPVNGAEWLRAHAAPSVVLRWKPAFGIVSATGDLGFTSGPFEDWEITDTTGTKYHGEFLTAWKRQGDGSWRFVFDFGISHPEDTWNQPVDAREIEPPVVQGTAADTTGARENLLRNTAVPSAELLRDIQLLRPDSLRILGPVKASVQLSAEKEHCTRSPLFADVSRSGDLAYTYGRYAVTNPEAPLKHGYFFTVWMRTAKGTWAILWDVLGRAR